MKEGIVRMSPGDGKLVFEASGEFKKFIVMAGITGEAMGSVKHRELGNGLYEISDFNNGVDYQLQLKKSNNEVSYIRFFRCGKYPGTVVNYIHPEDKTFYPAGMCPASPSIVKTSEGRLIVSHDIFYRDYAQNITKTFYSDDNGVSWHYLSGIEGCFWGKLFIHKNRLYILGHLHEYGDLVLYEAVEEGLAWEKACTVIKGGNKYTGGPHKSAMPITEYNGRLWTAIDFGSWNLGGHESGVVSVSIDDDITEASNWTISSFLKYDSGWEGTPKGKSTGCIEGNIVIKPDGQLINFLRFGIDSCEPNYGKALYLNIDKDNPEAMPSFGNVVDFHGNHTKFCIYYNGKTKKHWTIVNKADHKKPKRRNELALMSSSDLNNWEIEKILVDYEHTDWYENSEKTGLQYVDFLFNGDYIFYVARTAINGALNYHDSNCITFHVVQYI